MQVWAGPAPQAVEWVPEPDLRQHPSSRDLRAADRAVQRAALPQDRVPAQRPDRVRAQPAGREAQPEMFRAVQPAVLPAGREAAPQEMFHAVQPEGLEAAPQGMFHAVQPVGREAALEMFRAVQPVGRAVQPAGREAAFHVAAALPGAAAVLPVAALPRAAAAAGTSSLYFIDQN